MTSEEIIQIFKQPEFIHNYGNDCKIFNEIVIEKLTELEAIKEAAKDVVSIDYFTVKDENEYFLAMINLKNLVNKEIDTGVPKDILLFIQNNPNIILNAIKEISNEI